MPRKRQNDVEPTDNTDNTCNIVKRFSFDHFDLDSEEWEYYIQRFEIELSIHGITSEDLSKKLLLSKIGARPFKLLADHFRPASVTNQKYEDIKQVLSSYYDRCYSTLGERVMFGRRHRQDGESICQFSNTLRGLAGRCQFGSSLDERLRDQLLLGINNDEWQKELLRQHTEVTCSFKDVEQTALTLERADNTQKQVSNHDQSISRADTNAVKPTRQQATKYPTKELNQGLVLVRGQHCFRCGDALHTDMSKCPAIGKGCNICHGKNHLAKVCLKSGKVKISQSKRQTNSLRQGIARSLSQSSEDSEPVSVRVIKKVGNKVMMPVLINKVKIDMLYDPGAAESVISFGLWKKIGSPKLEPTSDLVAYTGISVRTIGKALVSVSIQAEKTLQLPIIVVEDEDIPLFGLSWVLAFNLPLPPGSRVCTLNDSEIPNHENKDVDSLLSQYSEIFSDTLGKFKGQKAVIKLNDDAVPKVCKPRPIPYSLRPAVEEEINRLLEKGVLESIDPTTTDITWASPIVVVVKSNGSVRVCGDFKATINPYITPVQHPLPKFEDIMAKLEGGEEFTKIDLKDAYLQVEVEEDSRKYLVISTPFGYFRYTRLPFGVRCAPGDFQRKIEQVLLGVKGVAQYLDDSIITGKTREEHLKNLEEVLIRFKESGIRIQKEKCKFLQKSVTYLGHKIDKSGIHPSDKHLQAVRNLPRPSNVRDLRAFLGAINYYQRFIPRLQCIASPLHRLLKKGESWNWTVKDEDIFNQLKSTLTSSDTLVHYNDSLPLVVDSDASNAGLGAVLSHQYPDGSIRPIAFASRVLQSSEKSYSVIDKEALGIIFAVTKFHDYIYGRHFTLRTDHKPLVHIFGQHVELPRITSDRLTRWAVILGAYNFDIKYNEGKSNAPADLLSRLPIGRPSSKVSVEFGTQVLQLRLDDLHLTHDLLKKETSKDECIQQIVRYIQSSWPDRKRLDQSYQIFYDKRDELSYEDGILLWKGRIVVPKSLRRTVLQNLHEGHPGIVGMRTFARFHVWWPGMNSTIEEYVSLCNKCQQTRKQDPELPLFSWVVPQEPWTRIHIDYTGPYHGFYWLVIVDSTSKWLEVLPTKGTTSHKTISMLEETFTTFGLPKTIVSDNGPQFTSAEFKVFCKINNIRHVTTAPYHPRSNGLAERYIQTFKRRFEASKLEGHNLTKSLQKFLYSYRITPHSTTGKSPGELMFGRQLQTPLTLLKPNQNNENNSLMHDCSKRVHQSLERQKRNHDKPSKWREYKPGDAVWVKLPIEKRWREGQVVRRTGPVSYIVREEGKEQRRHGDQLRRRQLPDQKS